MTTLTPVEDSGFSPLPIFSMSSFTNGPTPAQEQVDSLYSQDETRASYENLLHHAEKPQTTTNHDLRFLSRHSALIFVCTIAGILLLINLTAIYTHTISRTTFSCGNSPSSARASGCILDLMSRTWVHPSCYNATLTEEFLARNWTWYLAPDASASTALPEAIPREMVPRVLEDETREVLVSWEFHIWHCSFTWRKLHLALMDGGMVDSYIANYHHTEHCSFELSGPGLDLDEVSSVFTTKFTTCSSL